MLLGCYFRRMLLHALGSPFLLQASSLKALHSLLCHCEYSLISDRCSYAQSCHILLQASSIEVLQSLLEANERFRGKVQQQHYTDEMLRVSRWLLSRVSMLAHHNCACACAQCLSVHAGSLIFFP